MIAFLAAVALVALPLAVHTAIWRLRPPQNRLRALVAIFGLTTAAGLLLLLAIGLLGPSPRLPCDEVPGIALFACGAMGCYLIIYTGIEDPSPSLMVMRTLEAAGARGCAREELAAVLTEDRLVRPRLEELKRDHLVAPKEGGHGLTPRGLRVARIALLTARCFRLDDHA